jgi:cell wall-associated NlpC family hydrolase
MFALCCLSSVPAAGAATQPPSQWRDVKPGSRAWFAKAAIDDVAGTHDWMRDFGRHSFHPTSPETRGALARAVVRVFSAAQTPKAGLHFKDLKIDDPLYVFANVAVANGWMIAPDGRFGSTDPVDELTVSRAIVFALGLAPAVKGANHIHMRDGTLLSHPSTFGVYLIGRAIGLWHNHDPDIKGDSEAYDILPGDDVPRSDVAYALHQAASLGSSAQWYADQYLDLDVGSPSPAIQKVIEFGMKYVGYPYIYAGEWDTAEVPGYCCGEQLQGGFDCSGLTWWINRAGDSTWNNESVRGYTGWSLPQRSSSEMAGAIKKWQRIPFERLRPGDLMFYGENKSPASTYHVDTYIGGGWALDSGGDGVTILNVSDGWHRDTFQFGRRLHS